MKNTHALFPVCISLVGIIAFLSLLWITPYGSGVSPDSTIYIAGARSLLSGKGFTINGDSISHYPPLYPLFLAAVILFENNPVQASHFLNAILFGINVGLVALGVYLTTHRNILSSTFAALFFLSSGSLIELYSWAWSEPLFITFSLTCIILLSMHTVRPTLPLLIASSLSLGFAMVTRYIGVAFLPAALAILIICADGRQWGRRFVNIVVWLALACAPLAIVFVRNLMLAESASDRSFAFHPPSVLLFVIRLITNMLDFIAPLSLPFGVRPAILGVIVIYLIILSVILIKPHLRGVRWHSIGIVMAMSCLLFFVSYMLFLFISITFFDAATPVDARLLSPVFTILIVGVFSAIPTISQALGKSALSWCFFLLVVLSILIKTPDAIRAAAAIQKSGLGYSSREWQDSETISFVKLLPHDLRVYSNGMDVVGFLAEKKSLPIPVKMSTGTMEANQRYDEEIETMCKDIRENGALLVYFDLIDWRWEFPTREELGSTCHLFIQWRFTDGMVFADRYR